MTTCYVFAQLSTYDRIKNVSPEFISNYKQQKIDNPEENRWNPLNVGNHWQFKDWEGKYSDKKVINDTLIMNQRYFLMKQFIRGTNIYERNSDNASYRYDMYNIDSDSTTLELLCDSLNIPVDSSYYSYRYIFNPPYSRPPDKMKIIDRFWAYIPLFDDTVMAVTYERWLYSYDWVESIETWADKYGLVDYYMPEGTHSFISAAVIDSVEYGTIVNVEEKLKANYLKDSELYQNFPNPFNAQTQIRYYVKRTGPVKISVFDVRGRLISVLVNENKSPGRYQIPFYGTALSSGVYICKVQVNDYALHNKMILIR